MNTYFDNGATSFPKPKEVAKAISYYLNTCGGSYGRSSHGRSFKVSSEVEECRDLLAEKFNISDPEKLIFTYNATHAINTVLQNFNLSGKEILVSPLEHNSVMRTLNHLKDKYNIIINVLPSFKDGTIDVSKIKQILSSKTSLVVISHVSNVNGVTQPVKEIKQAIGDVPLMIDAAQSAGHMEINAKDINADYIAFTGHKGLLGPTGTGALYIKNPVSIPTFIYGGTGSKSESTRMPIFMPDKMEAGTPNIAGIFGLKAALENIPPLKHSHNDYIELINNVKKIKGVKVYSAENPNTQGSVFSITSEKYSPSELGLLLEKDYSIETRIGLHCSPMAHEYLGTYPEGTVRISISPYHTSEDFNYVLESIIQIHNGQNNASNF